METRIIKDLSELRDTATEVVAELKKRTQKTSAIVVALNGELGAGKTAFTKELAQTLGVDVPITSPTFVIMKRYETEDEQFKTLVHIDAYRIEEEDEMRVLGFERIITEADTIVCIEWAERIGSMLPENTVHISIEINDDMTRSLTLTYGSEI